MLGYPVNILLTTIQILGQQHYEGIETFRMRYKTTYFHIINPLQNCPFSAFGRERNYYCQKWIVTFGKSLFFYLLH